MSVISKTLASLDVSNIYVYVGDAVRWDFTPPTVIERGISLKTAAASIHSPTSFAALATGCNPPTTGVLSFRHRIASEVPTIFDHKGYETRFVNSVREQQADQDPIFDVLRESPTTEADILNEQSEPFIVMERGPGGHSPYGTFEGTAREYFLEHGGRSAGELRADYRTAVANDEKLFNSRLEQLEDEELLAETLVVYTSDHGELLGEGGLLGHNDPMRPELIYVPTVFVHSDLENRQPSMLFRHVDLVPTILDVLDEEFRDGFDGASLLNERIPSIGLSFYRDVFETNRLPGLDGVLEYEAGWDRSGGHVFARSPRRERLAILFGKLVVSPKRSYLRRHLPSVLRSYLKGEQKFGTPRITPSEVETALERAHERGGDSEQLNLTTEAEEHLHDLGYL